jgi:hypothetical protein
MNDLKRLLEGEVVRPLIGRACLELDDNNFAAFLDLCDDPFNYRIRAWSPDLKQDMTWLEHDRDGLEELFKSLPEHCNGRDGCTVRCLSPPLTLRIRKISSWR